MSIDLTKKIEKLLEDKKAVDISIIDIQDKTTLADYFIIASGTSSTHIKSLADNVDIELKKEGLLPHKIEGYKSNSWILMDYSSVIVNIFTQEQREHYNLEELWTKIRKD